jgi:hypothetical protein
VVEALAVRTACWKMGMNVGSVVHYTVRFREWDVEEGRKDHAGGKDQRGDRATRGGPSHIEAERIEYGEQHSMLCLTVLFSFVFDYPTDCVSLSYPKENRVCRDQPYLVNRWPPTLPIHLGALLVHSTVLFFGSFNQHS